MPLTRFAADAFGVVTICLVALLILLGLLCIVYSCYFRSRIHSEGCIQLSYFSGPWIIRITFILFVIWWGVGEISRLSFLRGEGELLHDLKWQETLCKCYIVSNLGFAEPCLFLTLLFLLRGPLQNMESGILSRKWNRKTAGYIFLYCFPVFVLQIVVILIGPQLNKDSRYGQKLPEYFTSAATIVNASSSKGARDIALCTYPLLSTILLGFFATVLTIYLFWLGRQILKLVINKNLQRRVYTLIFSVSGFLPLRVVLLGFSVSRRPEQFLFEALTFSAFLVLLCCAGLCICMLVYSDDDDDDDGHFKFLPCIIPNCTLTHSCSSAPPPGIQTKPRTNDSIFDPCSWVDCGGGSCNKTSPFTYKCDCLADYDNLLNITAFPCYKDCSIGMDCQELGIPVATSPPSATASSTNNNAASGLLLKRGSLSTISSVVTCVATLLLLIK